MAWPRVAGGGWLRQELRGVVGFEAVTVGVWQGRMVGRRGERGRDGMRRGDVNKNGTA